MLNIFILGNLHSYLIEFYIVKWRTLEQLPRYFHGSTEQVSPSGILCPLGPVPCVFEDNRDSAMEVGTVGLNFFECGRH